MDPDAQRQPHASLHGIRVECLLHLQRHLRDCFRVIRSRDRQPADDHVGVSDRFDLL